MLTSKKGRMSHEDRQRIFEMDENGFSLAEIAHEVQRREDVVADILSERKGRRHKAKASPETARVTGAKSLLSHQLWVRPGYQIELSLPADLTVGEAERLSVMVRSLPFSH